MITEKAAAAIILMLMAGLAHPAERPSRDMHQGQRHDANDKNHWYEVDCCSLDDCRPVKEDIVSITKKGYILYGGKYIIPHGDTRIRPSRDAQYHICELTGEWGEKYVRCLYIPVGY